MKKKIFKKRLMATALCFIMMLGLMPMTVFATPGAGSHTTSLFDGSTYKFTDGTDAQIWLYTTPFERGINIVCNKNEDDTKVFTVDYDSSQWKFVGWKTWMKNGSGIVDKENPNFDVGDTWYFSKVGDADTKYNGTDKSIQVNKEYLYGGVFYLHAIFEPILKVEMDSMLPGAFFTVHIGHEYIEEHMTNFSHSTTYGEDGQGYYQIFTGFMGVYQQLKVCCLVNGKDVTQQVLSSSSGTITLGFITEPTTVKITVYWPDIKVAYNSNGGTGTMENQSFKFNEARELTGNAFTRQGYIFKGWNTIADGSGTAYSDKQSVTFLYAEDTIITLYAQWDKCTDHNWENGECTKCGALCSHSGGEATCIEQAICDICGEKYGSLAKHSVVYSNSNNRIVETCSVGCGHTATAELVLDTNVSTVYIGSAIEALKVVYSDNWQGGNLDIAYSDNVNVGTAGGSVSISGATATQTFAITAAAMTNVSAQGYSGTYDGQAHGITVNAPEGATVSYKVGDGAYSAENAAFTNAGTYTVAYKVSMANHTDVEGTVEVTINKAPLTVTAKDYSIKYGEAASNSGVTYSGFVSGETESVLGGMLDFDYTCAVGDNIGTYEITPKGLTSNNYIISFEKGTLTVEQKELTITWGNTSLVYNKAEQLPEYVAAGIVSGDDVQFTVTGAAKNAATLPYTAVITGIEGNDAGNYKLPSNLSVEFTISRAKPDIGTVSVSETVYDTTTPKDVVLVRTNTEVPGRLSIEKAGDFMRADKTECFWEFTPTDVDNYEAIYGYVQIDVVDTTAPNASISIDEHQWTLWHTVTFGLFYNEHKVVTITSADSENGSGIKETLYYVADKEMTVEELQTVQWTAYTEAFEINPDGEYVIYAKVVDNDGNITIINSDGVVLDKTAPVLAGITGGEAYYGDTVFKALDDYLDVLKVDGVDVTAELNGDNEYKIIADNAEHTVTAIDKAGNVTEYKITVYKNYTVTYKADGETVSTETVGHGKDANLPAVPAKNGYTGKWDHDGKNVTSDIIINAIYAKNSVPAPSDPQSPQTGDNSNLWLWFVLLLVSGAGIFGITHNERKRKAASKR